MPGRVDRHVTSAVRVFRAEEQGRSSGRQVGVHLRRVEWLDTMECLSLCINQHEIFLNH
jgi:hypothetical protein